MSALLVLLPALGTAQGRIYLAYAEGEGGRPLGAYYSHGKLVALERRDWDLALATFRAGRVLCTDPHVQHDLELWPLEDVIAEADLLVIATPHAAFADLDVDIPVVDIWNLLGRGERV